MSIAKNTIICLSMALHAWVHQRSRWVVWSHTDTRPHLLPKSSAQQHCPKPNPLQSWVSSKLVRSCLTRSTTWRRTRTKALSKCAVSWSISLAGLKLWEKQKRKGILFKTSSAGQGRQLHEYCIAVYIGSSFTNAAISIMVRLSSCKSDTSVGRL